MTQTPLSPDFCLGCTMNSFSGSFMNNEATSCRPLLGNIFKSHRTHKMDDLPQRSETVTNSKEETHKLSFKLYNY